MNDSWSAWQQPAQEKPSWLTPEIEQTLIAKKFPANKDGMLMLWKETEATLKHFKELEMEYRKVCVGLLVPEKTEGTTNVELGGGYVAKAVTKFNYKLKDNDTVDLALDKISKVGNQGAFIAERLVSWHPSFLKTEYTSLQDDAAKGSVDAKAILKIVEDEMLIISDAAPTLTIAEPKKKK